MDVCSHLVVFWGDTVWTNGVDFGVGLDVGGTKRGGKLVNWGAGSKNVGQNWRSKLKAKNGTKRVAVRALNFSTRPFCMKFRGGSNRDGPEGHSPQKWAKNAKKLLRRKIGLKVKNRVDAKKKNGRFWVSWKIFAPLDIENCAKCSCESSREGLKCKTPHKIGLKML